MMETADQTSPRPWPGVLESLRSHLSDKGVHVSEGQVLPALGVGMALQLAAYFATGKLVSKLDDVPPSKGYEPLLIANGWEPLWARLMAHLAMRHGRRRAAEAKAIAVVHRTIRFLATPRRFEWVRNRSDRLLRIDKGTTAMQTVLANEGVDENEFLHLLHRVVRGDATAAIRLQDIASAVAPYLVPARGPKVSAASATHELMLGIGETFTSIPQEWIGLSGRRDNRNIDALKLATKREFNNFDFESRPTHRRLARQNAPPPSARRPA